MEQYEKLLALGQGASADVFLARSTRSQALVAVKRVRLVPGKRLRDREAVLREVAILRGLRHPHVVACHGHFFDTGEQHIFIVQEYCEGGSLDQHIQARHGAPFAEGVIMRWFVQLALAVQHIHARRILHRDIKASNVFLTQAGHLKLGDFGIAKVLKGAADLASTFVGTPYYLSPELCADVPYSAKADIWALGCLLFELCALRPPFAALSLIGLFKKIMEEVHPPIPRCYSEALQGLICAILKKDPETRPSATSILATPYVQQHLSLFHLQEEPRLPQKSRSRKVCDREGGGRGPPEPPPESSASQALTPPATPPYTPQQQAEQPNDNPDEERLSTSGSGSQYSADFEQTSTSSSDSSSGGDTPSTAEATETVESEEEEEEEWELTEYPADFEDSEEESLEEEAENGPDGATLQDGQSSPISSPLGGSQKCSSEAGPHWLLKGEDCPCGSDDGSSTTAVVVAVAAEACGEHSSSTEDSEPWETCYLLRLLDLDSR
ncbi:uncharacterized protein [Tiliqua scincoides]|uniref:uncharacterized protein n=1 Tax=Tiliqua scincoides TaxID=71010 RepID=UPI0034638088